MNFDNIELNIFEKQEEEVKQDIKDEKEEEKEEELIKNIGNTTKGDDSLSLIGKKGISKLDIIKIVDNIKLFDNIFGKLTDHYGNNNHYWKFWLNFGNYILIGNFKKFFIKFDNKNIAIPFDNNWKSLFDINKKYNVVFDNIVKYIRKLKGGAPYQDVMHKYLNMRIWFINWKNIAEFMGKK